MPRSVALMNRGFQIADELARTHEVHVAIGARQTLLPQQILGRDLFRYLTAIRLMNATVDSRIGQRMKAREALIGSSPRAARRTGTTIHPRATAATGSTVTFADGATIDVDAAIWATGFDRDYAWVHARVLGGYGDIAHQRGVTASRASTSSECRASTRAGRRADAPPAT